VRLTVPDIATSLAEVGIGALYFDFRNNGDSEGEPRNEVAHYGRLQDWHNAIAYASGLPEVDAERMGIWGTSLGGRDVLIVASMEPRLKAVVTQAPAIKWTTQLAARMAGYGDDVQGFHRDIAADRQNRALGKEPTYVDFVKPVGDDVKKAFIASLNETERRNYNGKLTLQTYQPTALIDAIPFVEQISPIPLLFILAEQDFLPGQREAFEAAKEPKSLVTVGGNHFSPYTESKRDSIVATTEWFVRHLSPSK
jgi:uncharacterized protein